MVTAATWFRTSYMKIQSALAHALNMHSNVRRAGDICDYVLVVLHTVSTIINGNLLEQMSMSANQ